MNHMNKIQPDFSGCILITKAGKTVYEGAFGYSDLPNRISNTMTTRFATASAGKVFVAVSILKLIETGKPAFDSTIASLLDFDLRAIDPDITVEQLLTHTSGIPDYFDESSMDDYSELWRDYPNYKIRTSSDIIPLYIDKPMKGHNLMQAIARVNRVYKDKSGGLVVDYLGIASDLKKALSFYSDGGGKGDPAIAQEKAVQIMLEKLEVVSQMFHGFAYEDYFQAVTSSKLSIILAAEEHILGIDNGKKRYINAVASLSQAFSVAIPHEQAMDAKDEVSFFQAVKSRLAKFDSTGSGRTDEDIETAIRQVIDQALVTEQVVDIFDAAGIKKPDISILSEDFLLEVKSMEHKNVALEVLKKLLNDEIKSRIRKNLVQGKTLMEMLENSIKKYHNKIITAAEVIEELIALSKEIEQMDKEPEEIGLSDCEYAFYTALANNASAREVMEKDKLRELAIVLFERVKANASIDWTIKESVKAKLKVIVKRTLRQYGYPPDMQKLATETVLKQAELLANELTQP